MIIVTCSLRRSGSHFCQGFLMSCFSEQFVQFDGLNGSTSDLFLKPSRINIWRDGARVSGAWRDSLVLSALEDRVLPRNCLLSFEDCKLGCVNGWLERNIPGKVDHKIVIIRSIHDLASSRLKKIQSTQNVEVAREFDLSRAFDIWPDHVYCGRDWERWQYEDILSEFGRRSIGSKYGYREDRFNKDLVPSNGGGSSFTGTRIKGSEMRTTTRHLSYPVSVPRNLTMINSKIY